MPLTSEIIDTYLIVYKVKLQEKNNKNWRPKPNRTLAQDQVGVAGFKKASILPQECIYVPYEWKVFRNDLMPTTFIGLNWYMQIHKV